MNGEIIKILLVEDNEADADLLRETLAEADGNRFKLTHVERLDAALPRLGQGGIDVTLLDLSLPDAQGLDTVRQAQAAAPDVPMVVLTGLNDEALAVQAVREGAQDYLVKGQIDSRLLVRALRYAIERQRAQAHTRASLQRTEMLLKEIHHRVKNNLQVVSSLLSLQSGYIQDHQIIGIFAECQNRVESMALIHEKLYQSEDLAKINFAEYVRNLMERLFRSYVISQAITWHVHIDDVLLDADTAVPCSLIINELVSNALKHAFPAGRSGEIRIDLHSGSDNRFTLKVRDNGIGLPKDFDFRKIESLGLQLVVHLAEQLKGTLDLEKNSEGGTAFKVIFAPLKKYKEIS